MRGLLAKLEYLNPICSVKDRIGVSMVEVLEPQGKISPGRGVEADFRKHRHRPRFRGGGPELQTHIGDAGVDVDRTA